MSRIVVALCGFLPLLFLMPPAAAQDCVERTIHIRVEVNAYGSEGDVIQVAREAVDTELVGSACTGTATVVNNSSAHPDNDFIISSGGTTAVVEDFEREPFQVSSTTTELSLGEAITISVRLGRDGIASIAGETVVVAVTCQPPAPMTTTTTSTTQPPGTTTTTLQPETTTTETPVGGVSAGGGGNAEAGRDIGVALVTLGALTLLGALAVAARGRPARSS